MPDKHIHIVSFDIPYPPNYGGVIDVYYKLVALKKLGIKIHLHCFEYPGRERMEELGDLCESVNYYTRHQGIRFLFSQKPYIVAGRNSDSLKANLLKDDHPILFEGLHSCNYLDDPEFSSRKKIYRESNIEHRYYFNLFLSDRNPKNKLYFLIESAKLKAFQKKLLHADLMLVVSKEDTEYLKQQFPQNAVHFLPSFHSNDEVCCPKGKGKYALYHGNLEIAENAKAAAFLIDKVFAHLEIPLVIAGMNPVRYLKKRIEKNGYVSLVENPSEKKMNDLVKNAHVNVLLTFQATGLKLKLLNTLYMGRHCLVNGKMLHGTGLDTLCHQADTADDFRSRLKEIFETTFESDNCRLREEILQKNYSNQKNAEKLISLVYGESDK